MFFCQHSPPPCCSWGDSLSPKSSFLEVILHSSGKEYFSQQRFLAGSNPLAWCFCKIRFRLGLGCCILYQAEVSGSSSRVTTHTAHSNNLVWMFSKHNPQWCGLLSLGTAAVSKTFQSASSSCLSRQRGVQEYSPTVSLTFSVQARILNVVL